MEPNELNMETKIPSFEEVIVEIYEKCGIEAYDTKTVQMILKFMQKYLKDIYHKADLIKLHANKKKQNVSIEDIKLAIEAHNENSFYKPLSRETIENLAKRRNANPIPQPKDYSNLIDQIPESDYTLTQPNFEVYDEEIQFKLKEKFESLYSGNKDGLSEGKRGGRKRKRDESK